ncbi:unnamed protein product, partial [Iphiclides podalirius]
MAKLPEVEHMQKELEGGLMHKMSEFEERLKTAFTPSSPTIVQLRDEYLNFKEVVSSLLSLMQQQIRQYVTNIDAINMHNRRKALLFNGVPESQNDDPEQKLLSLLHDKMGLSDINNSSIKKCFRLGVKHGSQPRPLVVYFYDHKIKTKFRVAPRMVLLDCSKLQLGRGRRDDSVAAFRRRLEVFRELSLPMLKTLDQQHRLVIVDGDTDSPEVQEEFTRVLLEEMEKAEAIAEMPPDGAEVTHASVQSRAQIEHTTESSALQHRAANGLANGTGPLHNGTALNGFVGNNKIKPIVNNAPKIPTISQMTQDDVNRLYRQHPREVSLNSNHI